MVFCSLRMEQAYTEPWWRSFARPIGRAAQGGPRIAGPRHHAIGLTGPLYPHHSERKR